MNTSIIENSIKIFLYKDRIDQYPGTNFRKFKKENLWEQQSCVR